MAMAQMARKASDKEKPIPVGRADDPAEQEADRMADWVLRMPDPSTLPAATSPPHLITSGDRFIRRSCAACASGGPPCRDCEEDTLRMKPRAGGAISTGRESGGGGSASSGRLQAHGSTAHGVRSLSGSGQRLSTSERDYFEPRFGRDFSQVRLHTGGQAAETARSLGARAFAYGGDIAFADGEYSPGSGQGNRLLAHELAHTVQQSPNPARREARTGHGPEPEVRRSGLLGELGLDDVCISDVCLQDVAEDIGDIGVGGFTIGDITSPAENLAVSIIEASGADLGFVGDAVGPIADIATAGLDSIGARISQDGLAFTATLDDLDLGRIELPVDLPEMSTTIPIYEVEIIPGLVAKLGLRLGIDPNLILKLGTVRLRDIHATVDPLGLSAGGRAELYIEGSIIGNVIAHGPIEGMLDLPNFSSISLEGGLRLTATGFANGRIGQFVNVHFDGYDFLQLLSGNIDPEFFSFDSNTEFAGPLGLRVWLNTYLAARFEDKILCEYIWPGTTWEAGRQWNLELPMGVSVSPNGLRVTADEAQATYRDFPFEAIAPSLGQEPPLGLNCQGLTDLLDEYRYEGSTSICSRPLDFPKWTGLQTARHAFIFDPLTGANYAIREPLVWGNGVTTSCSPKTSASGNPDIAESSRCKPCEPEPGPLETLGQRQLAVSKCLQGVYTQYPGPSLYRNGPDLEEGGYWGPNSNSFGAAMAKCCHAFDPSGLGILPGWNHGPSEPCPARLVGDVVAWIVGLQPPELSVYELSRLDAGTRGAIHAEPNLMAELETSIGPGLWPMALRIVEGASSSAVPSLNETTAYQADFAIRFRHPARPGLHMRVDALHSIISDLEARHILDSRLARWNYVAQDAGTDALTIWYWHVDPATGERRAEGAADVEVYDSAFSDVGWLFSTIMHEWVHVIHAHAGLPGTAFYPSGNQLPESRARLEVEAYLYEIEHAVGTGLIRNRQQIFEVGRRLTLEYSFMKFLDQERYRERYQAAMLRVHEVVEGISQISIVNARRTVQETSALIEAAVARRHGNEVAVDREILALRRRRDPALIEVALAENPAIQVTRLGPQGDYRVPVLDGDGRVRFLHGGILVAWHMGPAPTGAFGLDEQLASDPRRRPEPVAIAGTAIQGRVHPYPPDVDFDEHLEITANSRWDAGRQVASTIIDFVDRNEQATNVEFTHMSVFRKSFRTRERASGQYFSRPQLLAARDGNPRAFGQLAGSIGRMEAGNMNTYWRGFLQDNPAAPPRYLLITKVITVHAENPRTHRAYIDSESFPDLNLAFLDEPDEIGQGNLGAFATLMCCEAVRRWRDGDILKAAKRAYNYFTLVGDLANMSRLEPLFATPQARASQDLAVLEGVYLGLENERYSVATRILTFDQARMQLQVAANRLEHLPDASQPPNVDRRGVQIPLFSPSELAQALRNLAANLSATSQGLLAQDWRSAFELNRIIKEFKMHARLSLGTATDSSNRPVVEIFRLLESQACPPASCPERRRR